MRTTVTLDADVAAAVEQRRRVEGIGVSEAVNQLVRDGLVRPARRGTYLHTSVALGLKVDVSNIGDVLDLLDSD